MKNIPYLLAIVERGGYPDYTDLYKTSGFEVETCYSMRRALKFLQQTAPSMIVVEFKYGPVYGSRLSNLESLFAAVEKYCSQARMIVLLDAEDLPHLQRLYGALPQSVAIIASLVFPIEVKALQQALSGALQE